MRQVALLLLAVAALAAGQYLPGGSSFQANTHWSSLCGKTTEDANATGLYSFNPNVLQFQQQDQPNTHGSTLPAHWLATVSQTKYVENASLQWGYWFSPGGANYSNDAKLTYDVCAFGIEVENTNFFRRAQDDNGDCTTAFDSSCVTDLQDQAQTYALQMTLGPDGSPRANLTADESATTICTYIASALEINFPKSCRKFMNSSTPIKVGGGPFTGRHFSGLYDQCQITDPKVDYPFYHIATFDKYTISNPGVVDRWYNGLNYFTLPLMLLWMPVANANANIFIHQAVAKLQCVRANTIVDGSRQPSAAPSPTPYSSGLSGGDIAGIVVGVIAGVGLIAGAAFFFFWRKRRQAKKLETFDPENKDAPPVYAADRKEEKDMDTTQEHRSMVEADNKPLTELSPDAEVAMPGSEQRPVELEDKEDLSLKSEQSPPAELPTNVPGGQR